MSELWRYSVHVLLRVRAMDMANRWWRIASMYCKGTPEEVVGILS